MAKQEKYKALEVKVNKQRELVRKEQEKLAAMEIDFYKAFHEEIEAKAKANNMTISDYLEAMS